MKIVKVDMLSEAGESFNEDLAEVHGNYSWILDGSSSLVKKAIENSESDGQWFVTEWNKYLKSRLNCNDEDLKLTLKDGIEYIKEKYYSLVERSHIDSLNIPSCSIAITKFHDNTLEYYILGDITLIIEEENSFNVAVSDNRIGYFDDLVMKHINDLQTQRNFSFKLAKQAVLPMLQKHRELKNTPNGYWILEFSKDAINYGIHKTIKLKRKTNILMMSDGFSQLYDIFKVTKDRVGLLGVVKIEGLRQPYNKLKELSNNDKECLNYPRLKTIDDASAIYIEIGESPHNQMPRG